MFNDRFKQTVEDIKVIVPNQFFIIFIFNKEVAYYCCATYNRDITCPVSMRILLQSPMPTNKNEGLDETFPDKLNPISGHKGQVDSHPTSLIIQMD